MVEGRGWMGGWGVMEITAESKCVFRLSVCSFLHRGREAIQGRKEDLDSL